MFAGLFLHIPILNLFQVISAVRSDKGSYETVGVQKDDFHALKSFTNMESDLECAAMTTIYKYYNYHYDVKAQTCHLGQIDLKSQSGVPKPGQISASKTTREPVYAQVFAPDLHQGYAALLENGAICDLNDQVPELRPQILGWYNPVYALIDNTVYQCGGGTSGERYIYNYCDYKPLEGTTWQRTGFTNKALFGASLIQVQGTNYLMGQGTDWNGHLFDANCAYFIYKMNPDHTWMGPLVTVMGYEHDFSENVLVRDTKILMIGGNFAANHDRVYIYDPTINPSGLQLMPNRLKVAGRGFACVVTNLEHIGYGVFCLLWSRTDIHWLPLDDPTSQWPPWEYFPASLPSASGSHIPVKFKRGNGFDSLMIVEPNPLKVLAWESSYWRELDNPPGLLIGSIETIRSFLVPWELIKTKCYLHYYKEM